jgi:hypothetical protein
VRARSDPSAIDAAAIDAPDGSDAIDAIDAPAIDAIDAPPGSSCLGGAGGAPLFSDDFVDLIGWNLNSGTWTVVGGEAVQSNAGGGLFYAFPAGTSGFTDVRIASRMHRISGTGSMELVMRLQNSNDGHYQCAWTPTTGSLRLLWTRNNGSFGGTLSQVTVDVGAIPGYDPLAPIVLEAQVMGGQLVCCVRDLAGATTSAADTRYTAGSPGIRTSTLAAAFDDVTVQQP